MKRPLGILAIALTIAPAALFAETASRDHPPRAASAGKTATLMVVAVPVVDVRAQPQPATAAYAHDALQETQLLYGERVKVVERAGGWARIEAQEQPEFTHHQRWEGYPGWVPLKLLAPDAGSPASLVVQAKWAAVHALPDEDAPVLAQVALGTWLGGAAQLENGWWRVHLINGREGWLRGGDGALLATLGAQPAAQQRRRIISAARAFLDDPYRWGGRSPYHAELTSPPTGVDCSGLVQLAYRAVGLSLPRDAHEQYLRSRRITRDQLQPGDLVFLSTPQASEQVVHVLLYAGEGRLIEGPGTGERVREVIWVERFGAPFGRTEGGQTVNNQTLWFGAYLP